jgi:hypothetical protein
MLSINGANDEIVIEPLPTDNRPGPVSIRALFAGFPPRREAFLVIAAYCQLIGNQTVTIIDSEK